MRVFILGFLITLQANAAPTKVSLACDRDHSDQKIHVEVSTNGANGRFVVFDGNNPLARVLVAIKTTAASLSPLMNNKFNDAHGKKISAGRESALFSVSGRDFEGNPYLSIRIDSVSGTTNLSGCLKRWGVIAPVIDFGTFGEFKRRPMRIAVAQMQSFAGDFSNNIRKHVSLIEEAAAKKARIIFFPELSLTGYEPRLAKDLASTKDDPRFDVFQIISDSKTISICVGMPIKATSGIEIGMIIFGPDVPRKTYSKQLLHEDEFPYFVPGKEDVLIQIDGIRIAPAICYESLQIEHAEKAIKNRASIYVASVAKSSNGVAKALKHYPDLAKRMSIPVLMANNLGPSDDFVGKGQSSVWDMNGNRLAQLGETDEGILIFDLLAQSAEKCTL
jgi:predicted amidohydrolase